MSNEPYFIAHSVTPDMGLRESINAMLEQVAYTRHDFGYLPYTVHEANHRSLTEYYPELLDDSDGLLMLKPRITDSQLLEDLVETLESLANDYPVMDDETHEEVKHERLMEFIEEQSAEDDPAPELIATAIYELAIYVEHSEYGANMSEEDWREAVEYARKHVHRI